MKLEQWFNTLHKEYTSFWLNVDMLIFIFHAEKESLVKLKMNRQVLQ